MMFDRPKSTFFTARNPGEILFLLVIVTLFFAGAGSAIAGMIMSQGNIDILDAKEAVVLSYDQRMTLRWANLIGHLSLFTISSLFVAFMVARRGQILSFLHIKNDAWWRNLHLYLGVILAAFPLVLLVNWLNNSLPLPDWAWEMENSQRGLIEALLVMEYPFEFFFNLLLVAFIPAIGEELFFRGITQPALQRLAGNQHLAVWITAILFSAIHFQFAGFFPRLFLGAVLGYLFLWSQNLIVPIIVHFLYNGAQIIGVYIMPDAFEQANDVVLPPVYVWLNAAALMALCLYYLYKRRVLMDDSLSV